MSLMAQATNKNLLKIKIVDRIFIAFAAASASVGNECETVAERTVCVGVSGCVHGGGKWCVYAG